METLIVLVAVIAAAAVTIWLLRHFPSMLRPLSWALSGIGRWLVGLCRTASLATDFLISPADGHLPIGRVGLWIAVALAPMVLFFALVVTRVPMPGGFDPGYFLVAGAIFPVLLLGASFVGAYEDYDVMDSVIAAPKRRFAAGRAAACVPVVALSLVLFAAYVVAIAWWLVKVDRIALVEQLPDTATPALGYILVGLRALPTDILLSLIDWSTGGDTVVVFRASSAAQAYYFLSMTVGWGVLVGLAAVAIQHLWQLRRVVAELSAGDERQRDLMERARLAPSFVQCGILRAAIASGDPEVQRRLLVATQEIGLLPLPQMFCARLSAYDADLQVFGLERCLEMFRYRTREFDAADSTAIFRAAAPALIASKLEVEPLKKLLRLMTSVIIVKKVSGEVAKPLKEKVMAALKSELAKPRSKEDAALRGFLRDLQSALGGAPIIVNPLALPDREANEWLRNLPTPPPAADPDAQPESPPPTVH
jgi:hypothetical protein